MDVNKTLESIREVIEKTYENANSVSDVCEMTTLESVMADAERLAELAEALDDWLSSKGFLPDAWAR